MKFLRVYSLELLILSLQFTPFAGIGTLFASLLIFYKVAFQSKLDILSLFLLLLPSLALRHNDVIFQFNQNLLGESSWFQIFIPTLKNTINFGPLALSPNFSAALAVPFRLIKSIAQVNIKHFSLWALALVLTIYELYLAIKLGITSEGGITVGMRIVLSMGVLLFPQSIENQFLLRQLTIIIKISIVLFLFGLLNNHWLFVSVAFPVVILFSNENLFWKFLSVVMILIIIILPSTFTIKLTLVLSLLLIWYHKPIKSTIDKCYQLRIKPAYIFTYFLFPIYIVFLTISQKIMPLAQVIGSDRFLTKLFDDRGQIWFFSLELIKNSNFFVVPLGRNIITYNYGILGENEWGAGAHNIYLEIARQNGVFVFLILFYLFFCHFLSMRSTLFFQNRLQANIIFGFIAVYMVYGLTGNSLVYDGVGFLFWLIFSQVIKSSSKSSLVYENSSSVSSK